MRNRSCRGRLLRVVAIAFVFGTQASQAAELKQEALKSWDGYVQAANSQMRDRATSGTFLWVDEDPGRLKEVRGGKILVSPVGPHAKQLVFRHPHARQLKEKARSTERASGSFQS